MKVIETENQLIFQSEDQNGKFEFRQEKKDDAESKNKTYKF